jgi:DNA-directed RNA polymerase subunit omega
MARITVEDCLTQVRNRFELVQVASKRTRQLLKGARALVDNTFTQNRLIVLSLREVAAGYIKPKPIDTTKES